MAGLVLGRRDGPVAGAALLDAIESTLARPVAWRCAIAAVMLLQVVLTVTHRPWLDEYQALQLALQSPDLSALLGHLHYEGHPPLWYLLLRGAGALVPVPWVLPLVATPFALAIQATILQRAPFARWERLAIAVSTFVLFEYGTLSRSMTMGVALFVVAFAWRDWRWSWLPLALLPMADFLFGVLSLILLAIRWRERRWWWLGVAAWGVVGALAAITVRRAPDLVPALMAEHPLLEFGWWLNNLSIMLLPLQFNGGALEWNGALPFGIGAVAGPLFLIFAVRQLRGDRFQLALWGSFVALTLGFSMFVYPLAIRHLSLMALLLIVLRWRAAERGEATSAAFRLWLATIAACGLATAGIAATRPFDTAPEAAATIERLGLADAHWIAFPDSRGQGISALTNIRFHKLGRDCLQDLIRWNYQSPIKKGSDLAVALHALTAKYGRMQLLTDFALEGASHDSFIRPIAVIPAGYDGQEFHLFTVGADLPVSKRRPPLCVPGQRQLHWRG